MRDAWEFDRESLSLVNGVRVARLTRKAGDVLDCLIRHRGRTVSQERMLREVWPGLHVTPDLIREYVCDLRAVLRDDPRAPRVIETVRGRGYRLVGEVHSTGVSGAPAPFIRVAVAGIADRSLDPRSARLALVMTDELMGQLGRYADLSVIANHQTEPLPADLDLRDFARRLAVRYVVTGALALEGGELWARFHLVDGGSGRTCWSRRVNGSMDSLPRLAEDVAAKVAGSLGGFLGEIQRLERDLVRRKPVASLDAYDLYLLGCDVDDRHDRGSLLAALGNLDRALELDPSFARAWYLRSNVCYQIKVGRLMPDPDAWRKEEWRSTERAYACDQRDPMILSALAEVRASEGKLAEALSLIERALDFAKGKAEACANLAMAVCCIGGDGPRSLGLVDRALALNPVPPTWYILHECRSSFYAGEYRRSIDAAARTTNFVTKHLYGALSAAELGREDLARSCWRDLVRDFPAFDAGSYASEAPIVHPRALAKYRSALAKLAAVLGEP